MKESKILNGLQSYSAELGAYFPYHCGNLMVAMQYYLPLKIIHKYLLPSQLILDWGCGEGHFSYLLMQEKFSLQSYAFSAQDQLNIVKAKIQERFNTQWPVVLSQKNDPITLPFSDGSYDAVLSLGVLEHVRETGGHELASLKEIYRLLKPGGYFFCFHFPNRYSWIEKVARFLNKKGIKKYYHPYLYRQKEIETLIGATPFRYQELGRYNVFPRRLLRHLPEYLASTQVSAILYQAIEKMFFMLNPFAQNYYFVLKK